MEKTHEEKKICLKYFQGDELGPLHCERYRHAALCYNSSDIAATSIQQWERSCREVTRPHIVRDMSIDLAEERWAQHCPSFWGNMRIAVTFPFLSARHRYPKI